MSKSLNGGLVLSRKPGECIRITVPAGEEQTILIGIDRSSKVGAKLRFIAAKEVDIFRSELDDEPKPPLVADAVTAL